MLGVVVIVSVVLIVLGAIVAALVGAWIRHSMGMDPYRPFRRADSLLGPDELSAFHTLTEACAGWGIVQCRVRAWDLVWIPKDTPHAKRWRNRVWHKHADMVVCDPMSLKPLVVVAVEPAPGQPVHARIDDLRSLCKAAGLPMLVIDRAIDATDMRLRLQRAISEHPGRPAADIAREQLDPAPAL